MSKDLNDGDEESLFIFLMHGTTDGADGPAQHVQVPPGPLGTVHLIMKLLCHDPFRIGIVQMSQIDWGKNRTINILNIQNNKSAALRPMVITQSLSHVLVEVNGVCVFHELSHHLTLVVFHHQNLLGFSHATHH